MGYEKNGQVTYSIKCTVYTQQKVYRVNPYTFKLNLSVIYCTYLLCTYLRCRYYQNSTVSITGPIVTMVTSIGAPPSYRVFTVMYRDLSILDSVCHIPTAVLGDKFNLTALHASYYNFNDLLSCSL